MWNIFLILLSMLPCIINQSCKEYSKKVIEIHSNLVLCISNYSHPIGFCGWCNGLHSELNKIILNKNITNSDGKPCIDVFIASSELQPFATLLTSTESIWSKASCDSCVKNIEDYEVIPSISEFYKLDSYLPKYIEFFKNLEQIHKCFTNFIPSRINQSFLDDLNYPDNDSLVINPNVCISCGEIYNNLSLLYNEMKKSEPCYDISNAMNRTQWAWYKIMKCRSYQGITHKLFALLPTLIFGTLLILFYITNRIVTTKKQVVIYRPSRVESTTELLDQLNNSHSSCLSAQLRNLTNLPPRIRAKLRSLKSPNSTQSTNANYGALNQTNLNEFYNQASTIS